jgi:signal transduction histidine kinase/ActR/RegA family two-component response regulator
MGIDTNGLEQNIEKSKSRVDLESLHRKEELEAIVQVSSSMRVAQTREQITSVVLARLMALFKALAVALVAINPENGECTVEQAQGIWVDAVGRHMPTDFSQIDTVHGVLPGAPCLAGTLLVSQQQSLGVIWIGSNDPINAEQQKLLNAIGDMAANALQRTQLFENAQRTLQETQALSAIGRDLMKETFNPDRLYRLILDSACKLVPTAEGAVVHLVDERSNFLTPMAASGTTANRKSGGWMVPGCGIAGTAFSLNRLINVGDVTNDGRFIIQENPPIAHSLMVVPIMRGEKPVGTVSLQSGDKFAFTKADEIILRQLGTLSGIAIENARLHTALQEQLTTIQKTQVRMLQSEKLAAIGELVAGVAHELNNPLTSIILRAQMLLSQTTDAESCRELELIVAESQRSGKIVRGLLEFARQRPSENQPVQLNRVINSALDLMGYELRTRNIRVEMSLAADLPTTQGDPYKLQQVIVNLLTNAWQSMEAAQKGSFLRITTRRARSVYASQEDAHIHVIRLTIQDDGPGIAQEVISRIFDPFFTTRPLGEGTGLGLSIAYGIISEHKGHIWVESSLGKGATFIIELPAHTGKPIEKASIAQPEMQAPLSKGRVLIIDDEPNILEVMSRALRRQGFQVDIYDSARKALENLAQASYDLTLCDIRMPDMSGPEFYQAASQKIPELKYRIIFTTGDAVNNETHQFLEETGLPYLNKPFDLADLLERVKKAVEGQASMQ